MLTKEFWVFYILLALRYLFVAGPAFLIFYVLFRRKFAFLKIQPVFPKSRDYYREVIHSFLTFIIFALIGVVLIHPAVKPYTQFYSHIPDYGWGYFGLSIVLALLIHDTYFYWTHRLMHHPRLFRLFHLTHHRSVNPSPWAAFAFNPLEALVEGSIIFVIAFLIPIHAYAMLAFLIFMTVYNVYGHLGYEIFPNWLVQSRLGQWLNTSTNHNQHHKYFKGNYGLYLRFWDELLHTTHPDYNRQLTELVNKSNSENINQTSLSARKRTTETIPPRS